MNKKIKKKKFKKQKDGTIRGHTSLGFFGIMLFVLIFYIIMIVISKLPTVHEATQGFLFNILTGPIGIFVGISYVMFILASVFSMFFPLIQNKVLSSTITIIGVVFFGFLAICWIGNYSLTKTGFTLGKEHMEIFLTTILVVATIINISFYRKQAGINRLTTLDYHLDDKLKIKFENKDKFIAREVVVSLFLRKMKKKESENEAINATFRNSIFKSRDMNFGTIALKDRVKSIRKYIENSTQTKIRMSDDKFGETQIKYSPRIKKGKYILFTEVNFKSDLGERNKYTIKKYTQLDFDGNGRISIKEI